MTRRRSLVAGLGLVGLLAVGPAFAEPTPTQSRLVWDAPAGPAPAHYVLYWATQAEPEPRVYSDARRVLLPPGTATEAIIIDAKPDATAGLCFRLTAANSLGQESAFSNEACGFFGLPGPTNARVE